MNKPYVVNATFGCVIVAPSPQGALELARSLGADDFQDLPIASLQVAGELLRSEGLPPGWDEQCLPHGDNPLEACVGEFIPPEERGPEARAGMTLRAPAQPVAWPAQLAPPLPAFSEGDPDAIRLLALARMQAELRDACIRFWHETCAARLASMTSAAQARELHSWFQEILRARKAPQMPAPLEELFTTAIERLQRIESFALANSAPSELAAAPAQGRPVHEMVRADVAALRDESDTWAANDDDDIQRPIARCAPG